MNIQDKINESKRRVQIINTIMIDWQYAQQILPMVLPIMSKDNISPNSPEFVGTCNTLHDLFNNIELNIKTLKNMIPAKFSENIIEHE